MKSLVRSREYLSLNRRSNLGRSLAASIAGALPIPMLDEWLSSTVRRSMIRRIAESRGVDIDEEAIIAIADGGETPPKWSEFLSGGLALRLLSRQWKKLVIAIIAAKRAQAASKNFEIATLFDHYCAREHVGLGLNGERGKEIRALIDRARKETPGGINRQLFRRGVLVAARSSLKAPMEMANLLSGGRVRTLLKKKNEVEAATEVDEALELELRSETSFLSRSVLAMELQLAADRNPYIEELLTCFDAIHAEYLNRGDR